MLVEVDESCGVSWSGRGPVAVVLVDWAAPASFERVARELRSLSGAGEDDYAWIRNSIPTELALRIGGASAGDATVEGGGAADRRALYRVEVYWLDDDERQHPHGTWEGRADGPEDARRALEDVRDERTERWGATVLGEVEAGLGPDHWRVEFEIAGAPEDTGGLGFTLDLVGVYDDADPLALLEESLALYERHRDAFDHRDRDLYARLSAAAAALHDPSLLEEAARAARSVEDEALDAEALQIRREAAERALEAYLVEHDRDDPETVVGDLVGDLLHWLEGAAGPESAARALRCARVDWRAERPPPSAPSSPSS